MKAKFASMLLGCSLHCLLAGPAWSQPVENLERNALVAEIAELAGDEAAPEVSTPSERVVFDGWTAEEREILERGEYDRRDIIGGGIAGTLLGFGVGHSIQGRYRERGWIYTAGEGGSLAATVAGTLICAAAYDDDDDDQFLPDSFPCAYGVLIGGIVVWSAFRLVEIVDVWAHPAVHNERFRKLKERTRETREAPAISFQISPYGKDGATAGLALRF